ncbi:Nucleolar protein 9, partial [Coelomomyces lativittatus]
MHPSACRVFEKILEVSEPSLFHFLLVHFFRPHLLDFCHHPSANYIVQTLFLHVRNEQQLELLLDDLLPSFDSLLFGGRPWVVLAFLQACMKHHFVNAPKRMVKAIYHACGSTTSSLFWTLMYLSRDPSDHPPSTFPSKTTEGMGGRHGEVSKAGCQLLGFLFQLPSTLHQKLVDAFLAMDMHGYHPYLGHPVTTYVFEALVSSSTVHLTPKKKLLFSLLPSSTSTSTSSSSSSMSSSSGGVDLLTLALDPYGSHLIDRFWKVMDLATKKRMASFLATQPWTYFQKTWYGQCIWRNCQLAQYHQHPQVWEHTHRQAETKKRLFHEKEWALSGEEENEPGKEHEPPQDTFQVKEKAGPHFNTSSVLEKKPKKQKYIHHTPPSSEPEPHSSPDLTNTPLLSLSQSKKKKTNNDPLCVTDCENQHFTLAPSSSSSENDPTLEF